MMLPVFVVLILPVTVVHVATIVDMGVIVVTDYVSNNNTSICV